MSLSVPLKNPFLFSQLLALAIAISALVSLSGCSKANKGSQPSPAALQYVSEINDGRSVSSIAFSPDGRTLACGGGEPTRSGEVKLWDTQSGNLLRTLAGHTDAVTSVAFSSDGKIVASGSGVLVLPSAPFVQTVTGRPSELKLWDVATGELKHSLTPEGGVATVAFSPDGRILASGGADKSVSLWESQTGVLQRKLNGHDAVVTCLVFSRDGNSLASGSADKTVRIWDVQTGELKRTLKNHDFLVTSIAFSPDAGVIASGDGTLMRGIGPGVVNVIGRLRLWDTQTGEMRQDIFGLADLVTSLAFTRDGKTIVSSTKLGWIYFHDAKSGKPQRQERIEGEGYYEVNAIAFSPDGRVLAVAKSDHMVKLLRMP